jgi:hypothetical protein
VVVVASRTAGNARDAWLAARHGRAADHAGLLTIYVLVEVAQTVLLDTDTATVFVPTDLATPTISDQVRVDSCTALHSGFDHTLGTAHDSQAGTRRARAPPRPHPDG